MIETIDIDKIISEAQQRISSIENSALDLSISEITAEKDADEPDLGEMVHNSNILFEIITEQARSKRTWQIAAAFLAVSVVVISFVCFRFYVKLEGQVGKFGQTEINIQKANNDLIQAGQKIKTLEGQLADSETGLKNVQDELARSKSEAESLQGQLADTSQRLKTLQGRNAEAVKRLSERLQSLSD